MVLPDGLGGVGGSRFNELDPAGIDGVDGASPPTATDPAAEETQGPLFERPEGRRSGNFSAAALEAQMLDKLEAGAGTGVAAPAEGAQAAAAGTQSPAAPTAAKPPFDPETMPEIGLGTKSPEAATLQKGINDWRARVGKDAIAVNGKIGTNTRDNVLWFQKSNGLPQTGIADRATWRALASSMTPKPPIVESRPLTNQAKFDPAAMPKLEYKTKSKDFEAVETLQNSINDWRTSRNMPPIGVDKDYGGETRDAVKNFQRLNGLPQTGDADPATWSKLAEVQQRDLTSARAPTELAVPWVSQYDKSGRVERPGDTACFRTSHAMVNEYLANSGIKAELQPVYDQINVSTKEDKKGDVVAGRVSADNARSYVDRSLDAGLPAIVGISHKAGSDYNRNAVTDHFVVITGRGVDENGREFYKFNDPSRGDAADGQGRFYIDQDGKFDKEAKAGKQSGLISDKHWEVSEVRAWKELP